MNITDTERDEIISEWVDDLLSKDESECRVNNKLVGEDEERERRCALGLLADVLVRRGLARWDKQTPIDDDTGDCVEWDEIVPFESQFITSLNDYGVASSLYDNYRIGEHAPASWLDIARYIKDHS